LPAAKILVCHFKIPPMKVMEQCNSVSKFWDCKGRCNENGDQNDEEEKEKVEEDEGRDEAGDEMQ